MVELDAHRCGAARQRERVQAVSGAVRHRGGGIHGRGPARFPYHGRRGIRGHCSGDFERSPVCRYHPLDGGRDGRAVAGRDAGAFLLHRLAAHSCGDGRYAPGQRVRRPAGRAWLRPDFARRREHGRFGHAGKADSPEVSPHSRGRAGLPDRRHRDSGQHVHFRHEKRALCADFRGDYELYAGFRAGRAGFRAGLLHHYG